MTVAFSPALLPPPSPGMAGSLVLACLGGPAIGLGVGLAGHGILAGLLAAWLSAIALTVAIPAACLLLGRAPASAEADLAAWGADLEDERRTHRPARRAG